MSPRLLAALLALGSTTLAVADLAHAQDAKTTTTVEKKEDDGLSLPPLPADKTISQSARIGGKVITYNATVGHVPVRDAKGKVIGEVVYTAYTLPGAGPNRPVTFAFNGGPGASSVYLNYGAVGPKRVQFGAQGDAPSDRPLRWTIPIAGSTLPTWCSSIRSALVTAAAWWTRPKPRRPFTATIPISAICPRWCSTGW
ncbi:hypothetical protein ACFS32_12920 [Novosphingobium pokkalii]|uniref:hypothetical protein n=1 Tax=Novosphingobium pokkalii TaxID=1770194 RepID=UPI0036374454